LKQIDGKDGKGGCDSETWQFYEEIETCPRIKITDRDYLARKRRSNAGNIRDERPTSAIHRGLGVFFATNVFFTSRHSSKANSTLILGNFGGFQNGTI